MTDVHLGFFSDFDLGGAHDDFGGSDSAKQIAFIYNGDPFDEDSRSVLGYGANPPVAAIQTLKEPTIGSKSYPMSSCIVASNNINAETGKNASEMYNALQGLKTDGKNYLNKQGKPTRFMYEGQPDVSTNSECKNGNTSGDRRLLLGYGPMDLNPGEIIEYSNSNTFRRDLTPNYSTCCLLYTSPSPRDA